MFDGKNENSAEYLTILSAEGCYCFFNQKMQPNTPLTKTYAGSDLKSNGGA